MFMLRLRNRTNWAWSVSLLQRFCHKPGWLGAVTDLHVVVQGSGDVTYDHVPQGRTHVEVRGSGTVRPR